ncbi:MAG: GAF domain-containing protein, partial [Balneolaceae bacterium]|nr:GAF domain-containing protein [Balneolaceae bacterium]
MNSYPKAESRQSVNAELMGQKRQEKALREFKEVLEDLVLMLREASGVETVCLYWINRARRQFVMETKATKLSQVVFQDRVGFADHFLDDYKNIRQPVTLHVGDDINPESIDHYYEDRLPIDYVNLLPFTNNEETVAITVLESKKEAFSTEQNEVIHSYINALGNVLNTYLEISDLYENEGEWVEYEESLSF